MKVCTICKIEKEDTEFNWKNKEKGKLQSNCRACQKIMKDRHYQNNKDFYYERNKKRKQDYRDWFSELRTTLCCERCDENHPAVLDFHHKDPSEKEGNIGAMIHGACSKDKILEEISKCIVLCSNCHRKLHYDMRNAPSSSG